MRRPAPFPLRLTASRTLVLSAVLAATAARADVLPKSPTQPAKPAPAANGPTTPAKAPPATPAAPPASAATPPVTKPAEETPSDKPKAAAAAPKPASDKPPVTPAKGEKAAATKATSVPQLRLDVKRTKLDNGLRVVMLVDHTSPTVAVDVVYDVGGRNEERGRSGFAHLFEHMMFQGSANVPRGEHFKLVTSHGGQLNGTTSEDRTNYFEMLPSSELALGLW
ncbi:MAG TPA: insulinase family protein, partial [Labilithrix sp.]|nr:insulinase family protein [Labilithrix sp.]